jgi:hypothetical protein
MSPGGRCEPVELRLEVTPRQWDGRLHPPSARETIVTCSGLQQGSSGGGTPSGCRSFSVRPQLHSRSQDAVEAERARKTHWPGSSPSDLDALAHISPDPHRPPLSAGVRSVASGSRSSHSRTTWPVTATSARTAVSTPLPTRGRSKTPHTALAATSSPQADISCACRTRRRSKRSGPLSAKRTLRPAPPQVLPLSPVRPLSHSNRRIQR